MRNKQTFQKHITELFKLEADTLLSLITKEGVFEKEGQLLVEQEAKKLYNYRSQKQVEIDNIDNVNFKEYHKWAIDAFSIFAKMELSQEFRFSVELDVILDDLKIKR
jgi:hypothetical protein